MKIQINQLGPIQKSSTINLDKRFMVFVGENGSGKTYVANLLFGILKASSLLPKQQHNEIVEQLKFDDDGYLSFNKEVFLLNFNLDEKVTNVAFKGLSKKLQEEISVSVSFTNYNELFDVSLRKVGYNEFSYSMEDDEKRWKRDTVQDRLKDLEDDIKRNTLSDDERFFNVLLNYCYNASDGVLRNIYFFPANRASILSTYKYIIQTERQEREEIFNINKEGRRLNEQELNYYQASYSTAYESLIARLEKFDTQPLIIQPQYQDLLQDLEEIMGGSIKVSETLEGFGRRRYTYTLKDSEEELELFMASSSVNQLSTLYLYLKYWVQDNHNAIVIDEPEINLHPENQVKLVNLLMKFADRDNNKVIMTTHSPLLADAVNNHIRIGYLQAKGGEQQKAWLKEKEEYLKKHAFDLNENLTYQDFVVYHFEKGGIEEYPVTDYGVAFESFNEAIKDISEVEGELKDQIYDSIYEEN